MSPRVRARAMALRAGALLWCLGFLAGTLRADAVTLLEPVESSQHPIHITAQRSYRWRQGDKELLYLEGQCAIAQGSVTARAASAIVWMEDPEGTMPVAGQAGRSVVVYLEQVAVDHAHGGAVHRETQRAAQTISAPQWLGRFESEHTPRLHIQKQDGPPPVIPELFKRGEAARQPTPSFSVAPVQFTQEIPGQRQPLVLPPPAEPLVTPPPTFQNATPAPGVPVAIGVGTPRRVRVHPRGGVRMQAESFTTPDGRERVTVLDSGVNVLIEGDPQFGAIDIATDRIVIWTPVDQGVPGVTSDLATGADLQLEFYLEGNIVFRQADRVIYADRMYYNVPQESGVILQAELLTSIPKYEGVVRMKADVLRQINRSNFQASGAAATSSRMGVPGYWFQSEEITFQDNPLPQVDPVTGLPVVDPLTGQPRADHQILATSSRNMIYVGGIPVFYWPFVSTNLAQPSFFLERISVKNDNVFGTQLLTQWNLYRLLGISNPPVNSTWSASLDYLSKRGLGFGSDFTYDSPQFLGIQGPAKGFVKSWFINDTGLDNLGEDRRAVPPEEDFRGRLVGRHRQYLRSGWQVTGELGWISDRNFLESFFEYEWDNWKDQSTDLEFKRLRDDTSLNVFGRVRVNDFFTETEWFPRLDYLTLGRSILGDRLTWFGHSQVGYGHIQPADAPLDPDELAKFNPLPQRDVDRQGVRAVTRQEIDLPFHVGPVNVVPYALGEVAYWGEDLSGNELTRLLGQAGVRASLPMWKVDRGVQNTLLNLNGLAHKIVHDVEFFWADADQNVDDLALYDEIDDNSIEHFRRRFVDDTFGGLPSVDDVVPPQFDSTGYALRSGLQRWVTAPTTEIADDLMAIRLGSRHRWQTKRGLPGRERTVDWMTIDVEGTLFPKEDRDNFGSVAGLMNYDFRWHLGDRTTLLSDGYVDTFDDGLKMFTVGGYTSRPTRGSAYFGYRAIRGPFESDVLLSAYNYRISHKWLLTSMNSWDLRGTGNIRTGFEVTRIGESFLVSLGVTADRSRDNIGFGFAIEPRFLPSRRRHLGGVPIAPAGAFGLE